MLIGLPALRIQGLFLAVTTLAFAFTVQYFLLNRDYFDWALPEQGEVVGRARGSTGASTHRPTPASTSSA